MTEPTFIATEPLFIGTARAHNAGDRVPAENVERHGWQDQVAREGTKAAGAAAPFDPTGKTVADVQAYLADADEGETTRVLDLERAGAARVTLLGQ
ncbi:hypothetical protein [Nocardioides sp.]|uniref:hypothetical protein n=1 Tax=Nocardioides sp. TaxID=35761 RepID=UPI002B5AE3BA|nr:hypothetical protein [Nocardioides sp.]HXH77159.1 hypothetical protein [Nocardioides sp.]